MERREIYQANKTDAKRGLVMSYIFNFQFRAQNNFNQNNTKITEEKETIITYHLLNHVRMGSMLCHKNVKGNFSSLFGRNRDVFCLILKSFNNSAYYLVTLPTEDWMNLN